MRVRAACLAIALVALSGCTRHDSAYAEQQWVACVSEAFPQQRVESCSAVIDNVATEPSRRAEALIRRGAIRATLGEETRAIADFGRALRIDPANASALTERGLVHQNRGAFANALRDYEAALRVQPGFELALQRRSEMMHQQSQVSLNQLDGLNRAIAADPNNSSLFNNRCWARAVMGVELEFALADCDRAVALAPTSSNALDSRGLVHYKRGEYAEAIADYNAALAIEPRRGHFLYGRGLARRALGDTAAAEDDFAAAQAAEPGVDAAYRSYGVAI